MILDFLKKLLGGGSTENIKELYTQGAIIVDVRTTAEYAGGHIKNSINVPLHELSKSIAKLKKQDKTIITCCQSGRRSGMAAQQLKAAGIKAVNGGGWASLKRAIS
jgi:rhodanese-related sulfurtransferase